MFFVWKKTAKLKSALVSWIGTCGAIEFGAKGHLGLRLDLGVGKRRLSLCMALERFSIERGALGNDVAVP